ncbi:hypothetical protein T492DRAFT_895837 [Pavlovales sp. CCMP2436]|nr:hypothetical protein T492DRAFT_895837 [Pavlovales sp. CCMP2436]
MKGLERNKLTRRRDCRAEAGTYKWFAEDCFSTAQPITLMLPTAPGNFLVKAALADGSVALVHAQTAFALWPTPAFYSTYEWTVVPPGAPVPLGLEVQMALDGRGSLARMPDPWRLQLSLSIHLGMFRTDVYRDTTIGELAGELAGHALRRQQMHPHELEGRGLGLDAEAQTGLRVFGAGLQPEVGAQRSVRVRAVRRIRDRAAVRRVRDRERGERYRRR